MQEVTVPLEYPENSARVPDQMVFLTARLVTGERGLVPVLKSISCGVVIPERSRSVVSLFGFSER
jgi:hypothetical protein